MGKPTHRRSVVRVQGAYYGREGKSREGSRWGCRVGGRELREASAHGRGMCADEQKDRLEGGLLLNEGQGRCRSHQQRRGGQVEQEGAGTGVADRVGRKAGGRQGALQIVSAVQNRAGGSGMGRTTDTARRRRRRRSSRVAVAHLTQPFAQLGDAPGGRLARAKQQAAQRGGVGGLDVGVAQLCSGERRSS